MDFLKGKGTYLSGAAMIVYGIAGYLAGKVEANEAIGFVLAGIAAIRLRRAVG